MPTTLRLLILEDDPFDVELEVATLEEAGYVCQWERVETRAEFLACLDASNYDIILADYNLPAFDGLTALRLFLERDLDLPFILVSGTLGEETAIESLKAGATDYVLKDRLARLGPAVKRALRENEERRQRQQAEEALQKNQQLLNAIIDNSPVSIQVKDLQGRYLLINREMEKVFGLRREEVIGRRPDEVLPQEIAVKFLADDQNVLKAETAVESEYVIPLSNGIHTSVVIKFPLMDVAGTPYAVAGIATDITERKQIEEALTQERNLLRVLIDNLPEAVSIKDLEGRIILSNLVDQRYMGVATEDEVLGKTDFDIYPEEDAAQFTAVYEIVIRTGKPLLNEEGLFTDVNGRQYNVLTSVLPLRNPAGQIVGLLTVLRDITERKQAEEEREHLLVQIQKQARQVQQIIDTVPAGVLLLDADRRILLANPVARQALAVLTDNSLEADGLLTHLGLTRLKDVLERHADPLPIEITSSGSSRRIFEAQAQPIDFEAPSQWVLTLREVTQERGRQEQMQRQERLATVGQLAAGIAHDFNNILASIVLYSGMMLRSSDLSPRERQRLNTIRQQGHRAANLVQQILDFARKSIVERKPLDLVPFLKELEKLLARTLPENIHLEVSYGPEDYLVNADPTRIQQVVMNLALNARDAMPNGGDLRFRLSRFRLEPGQPPPLHNMPPGDWVRLNVTDNGTGIPPDVLPHVFEPFFTTKEVGKGTGLGLAQVYGIVRQHEGDIAVKSQFGYGTTFVIYLPALALPEVEPELVDESTPAQGSGETILVVEDNPAAREAIAETLTDLGYRVLTAANGREALALHSSDVALVLSDLVMPQMGGGTLYAALKEQDPEIKMIVITGYPLADDGQALLEQGITAWIRKPFSDDEIAQMVREALEDDVACDS